MKSVRKQLEVPWCAVEPVRATNQEVRSEVYFGICTPIAQAVGVGSGTPLESLLPSCPQRIVAIAAWGKAKRACTA